ncbi:MAG: hypothetical protein EPO21_22355 [Chloroflexota bacterium]|nr:MAG: hypothetical protein EPO21_22355 [Chloroflexota bacterium]
MSGTMRVRDSLLAICLVLAIVLAACANPAPAVTTPTAPPAAAPQSQPAASAAPAFKVGLALPLSGPYSGYGLDVVHGLQFAIEEVNNAGGIKGLGGAKIELVQADSLDPDVNACQTAFESLVNKEQVNFVIGSISQTCNGQMASLAEKYQIPTMGIAGALYQKDFPWFVNLGSQPAVHALNNVNRTLDIAQEYKLPINRIAVMSAPAIGGGYQLELGTEALKQRGLDKNVVETITLDLSATDLSAQALKLKAANPDVLITSLIGPQFTAGIKAFYSVGFDPPIWGDTNQFPTDPSTIKAVGEDVWRSVIMKPGRIYNGFYDHPDLKIKSVEAYRTRSAAWLKEHNYRQNDFTTFGSQGGYVLAKLLNDTKTRDKATLNRALRQLRIPMDDPNFVQAYYRPEIGWKTSSETLHADTVTIQPQEKDGNVQQVLLYPKEYRPAGVTFWHR